MVGDWPLFRVACRAARAGVVAGSFGYGLHPYLDDHVAADRRVLLVGDATPYDLSVPVFYNTVFDSSIFEQIAGNLSAPDVAAALAELRISHIYVVWVEVARYRSLRAITASRRSSSRMSSAA